MIAQVYTRASIEAGVREGTQCQPVDTNGNAIISPGGSSISSGSPLSGAPPASNDVEGSRVLIILDGDYSRIGQQSTTNRSIENIGEEFEPSAVNSFKDSSQQEMASIIGEIDKVEILQVREGSIVIDSVIKEPGSTALAKKLVSTLKSRIEQNETFQGYPILNVEAEYFEESSASRISFILSFILCLLILLE